MHKWMWCSVALSLLACAPQTQYSPTYNYQPQSGPRISSSVVVQDTQFDKDITFIGIEDTHGPALMNIAPNTYKIRSWVNKETRAVTHQLYVTHYYDGNWIFWNSASDQDAKSLQFSSISREVISCRGGCTYSEVFGAMISDRDLRQRKDSGYSVRFRARAGADKVIFISQRQISAQLIEVDAAIERLKSASVSKPGASPSRPAQRQRPAT